MPANSHQTPRPFLKWVGGKRQLLSELVRAVDSTDAFRRYHEPFLGGGALFFALARTGRLKRPSHLSDGNPNLIDAYVAIRDQVDAVIDLLTKHREYHNEKYFYAVRSNVPQGLAERAARIIYLNKTCFNGLYRENRKGHFNAPFGRYTNPRICDEQNLRAVAAALRSVHLVADEFEVVERCARKGDLVYFDPPYLPISGTADFTSYSREKFGLEEHRRLAELSLYLANRGIHVIVSNSSAKWTYELYTNFFIYEVFANRLVNSKAGLRGKIPEALVTSFPIDLEATVVPRRGGGRALVDSRERGGIERMLARQWLRQNAYEDVADLIDEVVEEWKAQDKNTRRNWWDVLAGDVNGKPRVVAGRRFPVLRAAQLRQGVNVTENALCKNPMEEIPPVRVSRRWSASAATESEQ